MLLVQDGVRYMEPRFVYDVNCVVFVGNISPNTTQDMLSTFFSQFGLVKSVNLKNSLTGRNRKDYAFIKFLIPESVQRVLNHHEVFELDGHVLEVRPRAGCPVTQTNTPIPQPIGKPTCRGPEEVDTFRTILVENIPLQWSPQFFFKCFTAYGNPTVCFIYDDVDDNNTKKGLIEMSSSRTAISLCRNTGFLLLPNNVTVKLTLTPITDFNCWMRKHSEWLSLQKMWASFCPPVVPEVIHMPPVGTVPKQTLATHSDFEQEPGIEKSGIVKVSNVDIKAFENSDEIYKKLTEIFGSIETFAIASFDSCGNAVIIFKTSDLENAKQSKNKLDLYGFPGTIPKVEFP